jgi:hypothetical protein
MRLLRNIEGDGAFSWSQTIDVSFIHIRNGNRSLLVIWYLLYESVGGDCLVKDSLRRNSLAESVTDFIKFFRRQGDMGCLHRFVVDVDDSVRILDRGDIVICRLFSLAGFAGAAAKLCSWGGWYDVPATLAKGWRGG